jgi:mycofactocin precursor
VSSFFPLENSDVVNLHRPGTGSQGESCSLAPRVDTIDAMTAITLESPAVLDATELAETDELLYEELLVEEISIDGMCGVY